MKNYKTVKLQVTAGGRGWSPAVKFCCGLAGSPGAKDEIPNGIFHWVLLDKVNAIRGVLLQRVFTMVLLTSLLKREKLSV